LEFKVLDDYSYIFKLQVDKILEKNSSIYVLSEISNNDIKVNPYKLINRSYKKEYDEFIALYNDIFNDEYSFLEQAKNIEKCRLPSENTLEDLYNWESLIEENKIIDLCDFSKESKIYLGEILLVKDSELQNIKREEVLHFFQSNLDYHITRIVNEL
jgi:hypothetical protein